MTETLTCPQCGHRFAPKTKVRDLQCPKCGTLQILADEVSTNPQSKSEQPLTRPTVDPPPSLAPRTDLLTPPEAQVSDQKIIKEAAVSAPEAPPNPTASHPAYQRGVRTSHLRRMGNALGPVILVCLLFVGWFAYDKLIRVEPRQQATEILTQALRAYRGGNLDEAKVLVERAILLDPDLSLGSEVEQVIRQKPAVSSTEEP